MTFPARKALAHAQTAIQAGAHMPRMCAAGDELVPLEGLAQKPLCASTNPFCASTPWFCHALEFPMTRSTALQEAAGGCVSALCVGDLVENSRVAGDVVRLGQDLSPSVQMGRIGGEGWLPGGRDGVGWIREDPGLAGCIRDSEVGT